MADGTQSWNERAAAADAARAEARWGMRYVPDEREAPERLAHDAAQRGDTWFQVDIPLSGYQGNVAVGSSWTRVWRAAPYDHIGAIERQGWRLEHVAACYVERGSSSNSGATGATEASTHGDVIGLYVFRRREG
jgi:hypothetical protein